MTLTGAHHEILCIEIRYANRKLQILYFACFLHIFPQLRLNFSPKSLLAFGLSINFNQLSNFRQLVQIIASANRLLLWILYTISVPIRNRDEDLGLHYKHILYLRICRDLFLPLKVKVSSCPFGICKSTETYQKDTVQFNDIFSTLNQYPKGAVLIYLIFILVNIFNVVLKLYT